MFEIIKTDKHELNNLSNFDPLVRNLLFFSNSNHPISGGTYSYVLNITNGKTKEMENDPSIIWTVMDIEAPSPNECVDTEIGYFPSYYNLDNKQKYLYLQWLKNIREPAGKSFLLILLYCLERNIVMGNYLEALDAITILRKHHKNEVFLNFSLGAIIGCAYYWKKNDIITQTEFDKKIGWYWYNDDLVYLLVSNNEIDEDDFIKLLLSLRCSKYQYFKDKRDDYKRSYRLVIKETYNKSMISMSDLVLLSQIELKQVKAFMNYKIDDEVRKLYIPNVIESKILKDNCKAIHEKVKERMKKI
jgi:hypothetical protein